MGVQTAARQVVSPDRGHICKLHNFYTTKKSHNNLVQLGIPLYCDIYTPGTRTNPTKTGAVLCRIGWTPLIYMFRIKPSSVPLRTQQWVSRYTNCAWRRE